MQSDITAGLQPFKGILRLLGSRSKSVAWPGPDYLSSHVVYHDFQWSCHTGFLSISEIYSNPPVQGPLHDTVPSVGTMPLSSSAALPQEVFPNPSEGPWLYFLTQQYSFVSEYPFQL